MTAPSFTAKPVAARRYDPLVIKPSAGTLAGDHKVVATHDYNWRMPIQGDPDMQRLGEAVHSSFACDALIRSQARSVRLSKVHATLQRWSVTEIKADDVIIAADRLWGFIATTYPDAGWRTEVPLVSRLGDQLVKGRIDVLIEGDNWFAILDHKSFRGARNALESKALGYAPQLAIYARGVAEATAKQCRGMWVHMPVVGTLLQVGSTTV